MKPWDVETIHLTEELLRERAFEEAVTVFADVDLPMTSQSERSKGSLIAHINQLFRECGERNIISSFFEKCVDSTKSYSVELSELLSFVAITHNVDVCLEETPLIKDFQRYYSTAENRLEAAVAFSKSVLDETYLTAIREEITAALKSQTGYSYVRVGDGEGRFLSPLTSFPAIWNQTKETAKRVWFWTSDYPEDSFFAMLREAVIHASSVGISPEFRLRLESRNSLLGYVGCVSGNNFVYAHRLPSGQDSFRIFPNWANVELDRLGYLRQIVDEARRVVMISCYPDDLVELRFFEKFQKRVSNLRVPAENHVNLLDLSLRSKHYPDVFYRTLSQLSELEPGTLVLVGAGVYGKIYCDLIRRKSSCAVDLGSVIDDWMGVKTR